MSDPINPDHYRTGGIETIDFIQYGGFASFTLGNAVKYMARAGKKTKSPVEDLKKALWYIERAIKDQDSVSEPYIRKLSKLGVNSIQDFCNAKGLSAGITLVLHCLSVNDLYSAEAGLRREIRHLEHMETSNG